MSSLVPIYFIVFKIAFWGRICKNKKITFRAVYVRAAYVMLALYIRAIHVVLAVCQAAYVIKEVHIES